MCQILFCSKANPTMSALEHANERNANGFGYAWVDGGEVEWNKGFTSQQFEEGVLDFLEKPFPKAIHFRLATHGGVSPELTHPFPIKRGNSLSLSGRAKAVLFHNGIWSCWDDYMRNAILGGTINSNILRSQMSDSRAMAILSQRFGPDFLDVCELGSNKVLVLMPETWYKYGDWKSGGEGWQASNPSIEKGATVMGQVVRHSRESLPGVYLTGPKSLYLSTDRGEVEQNLLEWGDRGYTHG